MSAVPRTYSLTSLTVSPRSSRRPAHRVERATATDYALWGAWASITPGPVCRFHLWRLRRGCSRTFLSGLSRLQSTVPAALHEHATWSAGRASRRPVVPHDSRRSPSACGRRLFGASVGRRLPPCALAEVAAGCGMSGGMVGLALVTSVWAVQCTVPVVSLSW